MIHTSVGEMFGVTSVEPDGPAAMANEVSDGPQAPTSPAAMTSASIATPNIWHTATTTGCASARPARHCSRFTRG